MIKVTRDRDKEIRTAVSGEAIDVIDELAHAAYAAACGICGGEGNRLDAAKTALFALSLVECIDLVQSEMTGDKKGSVLRRCEHSILLRYANPKAAEDEERRIMQ